MANRLKYEPCPRCVDNGRDSRGDNLVLWPDGSAHCFACGLHRPAPYSRSRFVLTEVNDAPKSLLPSDFSREVPRHALQWLLQWELPWSYWQESIGYSPSHERLVFRVGNPLQFSIGRYLGGDSSKRKWYVWGDSHKHCEILGSGKPIVLVEDFLSAHKVGQVATAIPLFGVEIHHPVLYHLMNQDTPIILWLDKDQESKVKQKAIRLQSIVGVPVNIVVTDKDPKAYSINKIKEILE